MEIILGLALLATLAVVTVGIISMGVHGGFYIRNANKMMRLRIIFQGMAVAVIALLGFLATF